MVAADPVIRTPAMTRHSEGVALPPAISHFVLSRKIAGPLILLICGLHAYGAVGLQFTEPIHYAVPSPPIKIATADFNADGLPDFAVSIADGTAPETTSGVAIYLGRPDGTLGTPLYYPTDIQPSQVLVGNFDALPGLDIVTVNYGSPTLSFLSGNGDGTFEAPVNSPTGVVSGQSTWYGAAGDFNADGKLDVAVPVYGGDLLVFLGNGDGTFTAAAPIVGGGGDANVVVADFNRDGKADIATAYSMTASISVMFSNGDGTFAPPVVTPVTGLNYYFSDMAAADINGDGAPDLVFTGSDFMFTDLQAFTNDGSGVLTQSYQSDLISTMFGVYVLLADVDGDSNIDAVLGLGQDNVIAIARGKNDGTFGAPEAYYCRDYSISAVLADVDGDSFQDIVTVFNPGTDMDVIKGGPSGSLRTPHAYLNNGETRDVAFADFNKDGFLDLVSANRTNQNIGLGLGDGRGSFKESGNLDPGLDYQGYPLSASVIATGDFDHDGNADIAIGGYYGRRLNVLFGKGDGTFETSIVSLPVDYETMSIKVEDVDGDGVDDILACDFDAYKLNVFLSNGNRTFKPRASYTVGAAPIRVRTADLDGDHHNDAVLPLFGGNGFSILKGNANGTFNPAVTSTGLATQAADIALADFNGDNKIDMALVTQTGLLQIYRGNGNLTFTQVSSDSVMPMLRGCVAGDFNEDGIPDLAVTVYGSNELLLYPGKGDLTFDTPTTLSAPTVDVVYAVDVNGDGHKDLAVPSGQTPMGDIGVGILLNTDLVPPISTLAPVADTTLGAGSTALAFSTTDTRSGMGSTTLWARTPGSPIFTNTGLRLSGTSGLFPYTFSAGNGLYEFATRAFDYAGTPEAVPTVAGVSLLTNVVPNGDFTTTVTAADSVSTFPMTNQNDVILALTGATPGGTLTVSRAAAEIAPPPYFKTPSELINESLTITGSGIGSNFSATLTWNFDPANAAGVSNIEKAYAFESGPDPVAEYPVTVHGNTASISGITSLSTWYLGSSAAVPVVVSRFSLE